MRQILVDFARSRHYAKRGGKDLHVTLDEAVQVPIERNKDLVALDDALNALTELDSRKAQVVELLFFGGLSVEEIAEFLQTSPRTVMRDWNLAQAWLHRELKRTDPAAVKV
jgi:RNA polymerase sigma factor (TIGR02999 family)